MEIPWETMRKSEGEERGGWVVLDVEEKKKEEQSGEGATAHHA